MSPKAERGGDASLLDHLRSAHLQGASGVLEIEVGGRLRRLHLERGELYLSPDSALAGAVRELGGSPDAARWEPLLTRLLEAYVAPGSGRAVTVRAGTALPAGAVGPLPTEALLRRGYAALAAAAVAPATKLVAEGVAATGESAPLCWSPEELWVIERLRRPMRYEELERDCPFGKELLRAVVAGLSAVRRVHGAERAAVNPQDSGLLRLVELLAARIGSSLRERPLGLLDDALQRRLGTLLKSAEELNHYQLLGVTPEADEEGVQRAFETLARQVHPSHAERIAVGVSPAALQRLFERAVAAFRTLSDPALRAAYDATHGIERHVSDPGAAQRREERAALARREFDRARFEELNGDLHSALVLYEQVVELDPRSDYYLQLALLQARNPAWTERALESCKRALELDPENGDCRYLAGELYERLGQLERAAALYQGAANARPPHPAAQDAVRRLAGRGARPGGDKEGGGGLGRLFRRG